MYYLSSEQPYFWKLYLVLGSWHCLQWRRQLLTVLLYHSCYRVLVEIPVNRKKLLQIQTLTKHSLMTVQLILGKDPLPLPHRLTSYWTLTLAPVTPVQPASHTINHRWYPINQLPVVAQAQCLTLLTSGLNRWLPLGRLATSPPLLTHRPVEQGECLVTLLTCLAVVIIPRVD